MPETHETPPESPTEENEDILRKLVEAEDLLAEIEKSEKKQRLTARVGLLLILATLALFAWNMYGFYTDITSQESIAEFREIVIEDLDDVLRHDQEIKAFQKDLIDKILPELLEDAKKRIMKEKPELEKTGAEMFENVRAHVRQSLHDGLTDILNETLIELEEEIHDRYPKIPLEKLQKSMREAENIFVEEITALLEKRMELIYSDLDEMEKSIARFRQLPEMKALDGTEIEELKLMMAESILELAIYHINPERGEKEPGGAK